MAHVSRKLSNAVEGALAGGGDPATSPLYIFGPFLKLIVVAGVAQITFGASVWLVIFTIATVSAMYRLVMTWVTDGSGGSGLSEEEFGGWAVKINAGITFVEYTLTFLVSMAALVTFVADRLPVLNEPFLGLQGRTILAIALSILTGWLVNRGPRVAAIAFGPATAAVLLLLWTMVFASIWRYGFRLPDFNWQAFSPANIGLTFGGYARILAVMTGIEVFANLVAAYDGTPAQKSRKAFNSLLIIMGTTSATMLIVGPVIFDVTDPLNTEVSVFTQTMDILLPAPLPWAGTLIGVAVLLSASAASAQGLQNLFVGLRFRHYVPAPMGRKNAYGVADMPVWLEVGLVAGCFLLFGTHEETYLAIYAAGVFILLSMTGWAAAKRLVRQMRTAPAAGTVMMLGGTVAAALLTSGATAIIFAERFWEGAWVYLVLLPLFYVIFSYFRRHLGEPTAVEERIGRALALRSALYPATARADRGERPRIDRLLVPLDGSQAAEEALPVARLFGQVFDASIDVISVGETTQQQYLDDIARHLTLSGHRARPFLTSGDVVTSIQTAAATLAADLIVMSTHGRTGVRRRVLGGIANRLTQQAQQPLLLIRPSATIRLPAIRRLLVPLDGSSVAESVLPFARLLAHHFQCDVILLTVAPDNETDEPPQSLEAYLDSMASRLRDEQIAVDTRVVASEPAGAILDSVDTSGADLIVMATRGRGGLQRLLLGSVAEAVVTGAQVPVFLVPTRSA